MPDKNVEIFEEILVTSKMGGFVNWRTATNSINQDDPSWTWQQMKFNPWLAMAVYEDIEEKDSRVGSCLETRKNAVLAKNWRIIPASESRRDKRNAEFIEETLRDYFAANSLESDFSGFDSFLFESLDALGRGVSIGEIIFADGKDRVYIESVKFKPQQLFAFGDTALSTYSTASLLYPQTGTIKLREGVMINNIAGGELPEEKFFVFTYRPKHGNRWGQALLKYIFWVSWMKRASVRQWLKYQEKGNGLVMAKYPGGASIGDQDKALEAATAAVEENAIAIPDRFALEVHELVRNLGSTHREFIEDLCNAEITLRLLGQTLSSRGSDGGGSRALGEIHEKVRGEYTENDCKQLANPINTRLVRPLSLYNFGANTKPPTFAFDFELEESVDKKAARFGTIRKEIGIEMSKEQIRGELQLDAPIDENDALGGTAETKTEKTEEPLDDELITEFAEKKKILVKSGGKPNSKTERFKKWRPSMIEFSEE